MASEMLFHVNPGDALPIYRQIVEQVKGGVAAGLLSPGDRLPSHRDLSRDLVVAPLTVKKAYDTLEVEGVVRSERGRGTFVATDAGRFTGDARDALEVRARGLALQARVMGLGEEDAIRALREAWKQTEGGAACRMRSSSRRRPAATAARHGGSRG